jgi:anaerobic magnesium-protoporphyrin IX monomethyl ester cyclase
MMMYKRVLLVFPDYKGGHYGALRPPAGLGYIAEILEKSNIKYDVVDMAAGFSTKKLKEKIESFNPDLVGISLMSLMHKRSYEIINFIKQVKTTVHVIAGGPHISTLREKVLKDCTALDYGSVLEGEELILELCNGNELSSIKGLIYRDGENIIFNGERSFNEDLDKLPFPKYKKFPLNKYVTEEIGIVSSRGCPYGCIYCPVKTAIGRTWRKRDAGSLVDEISYWHKLGYKQFSILDDNFTFNNERVKEFCKKIKLESLYGLEFNCNNGIRADNVNYDILSNMKEVGFAYLALGVEAGNNKVLKNINKGETIEDIELAIKSALQLDYKITLFFLVGSPGETMEDFKDSITLALKYPVFDVRFYNLIPFPQSKLYDWVSKNDYFIISPDNYLNSTSHWDNKPVFETPEMNRYEREKALKTVRNVRKKVRYNSMKSVLLPKFGSIAGLIARIYINDYIQNILMKNSILRRNLKKVFMRVSN